MNPQDPLANLNPLREPAAIGWWPLAPGWWILLAVVLVAAAGLAWWLYRRQRQNRYRRLALRALQSIQSDFQQSGDVTACVTAVNALLKNVALQAYPRNEVAQAHGQQWLDFLNSTARGNVSFDSAFAGAQYRPLATDLPAERFCQQAAAWIQGHEVKP
jgi:Domain of unknown function (DUF4381)